MTTERFSIEEFEKVLEDFCLKNFTHFTQRGFICNEYRYHVSIAEVESSGVIKGRVIAEIASSIGGDGYADPSGDNSIRIWLTDDNGQPIGNKLQKWVTRVPGWEERFTDKLTKVYEIGKKITWCDTCSSM